MDNDTILPMSNKRRNVRINRNDESTSNNLYQEVYSDMNSLKNKSDLSNDNKDILKELITNEKIIDSIANNMGIVLDIAKEIVRIKGSRVETENALDIMDGEIRKLQALTDDYVKRESDNRKSLSNRTEATIEILNKLTSSLKDNNMSDEIKTLLIETFSNSINKVWENDK